MKTFNEKEKKLQNALNKLTSVDIQKINYNNSEQCKSLEKQKNQLEIEKTEIENNYLALEKAHNKLKLKIEEIENKKAAESQRDIKFEEKIDELNQETDSLLEEVDKWQM